MTITHVINHDILFKELIPILIIARILKNLSKVKSNKVRLKFVKMFNFLIISANFLLPTKCQNDY